jgi:hypothetical protein
MALAGCGGESSEKKTYLSNKGYNMALAGCGEEGTEMKPYLLYVVEKKRTKATTWLLQVVEEREYRRRPTSCT